VAPPETIGLTGVVPAILGLGATAALTIGVVIAGCSCAEADLVKARKSFSISPESFIPSLYAIAQILQTPKMKKGPLLDPSSFILAVS